MVERDGIISTMWSEAWFEQLTSEKQVLEKKHGFSFTRWILPKGRANEALDCRVYAYAALSGLYAVRKLSLDRIASMIEQATAGAVEAATNAPAPAVVEEEAPAPAPAAPAPPAPQPRRAHIRRSSWMA
jgi:phage terminase large subunit GpA-like protein